MKDGNEKYREQLLSLAREGKLYIMRGSDLDYQYLPTNDGKCLVVATGVGCTACFTPEEWHTLLDEVYSSNKVYEASFADIVAIPYEDKDVVSVIDYGKWISFQESYPPLQDEAYNGVVIEILHEGSPYFHSIFHDGERVFLRCYDWHNDLLECELPEFTNDYWRFVPSPPANESYDVG